MDDSLRREFVTERRSGWCVLRNVARKTFTNLQCPTQSLESVVDVCACVYVMYSHYYSHHCVLSENRLATDLCCFALLW